MNTILLVEDDKFIRDVYADVLTTEGYTVETAVDGDDAFEKMHRGGWDLVFLDIVMPKMSAFEVMKKLETNKPLTPNKKIVFLTNVENDADKKLALTIGNGILIKSNITPDDLVKKAAEYLQ